LINSAHPDPEFPPVYHTYNAQYFPGSIATDDIKVPERKANISTPQEPQQEPAMNNTEPTTNNPFGIDAQPNNPDAPPQSTEPMIPLKKSVP